MISEPHIEDGRVVMVERPETVDDYKFAVQVLIDETARSRIYTDGVSLASYKDSTIAQWSAEATAFIAWRDAVWASVYATLAEVQSGELPQPTIADLIAMLPAPPWPLDNGEQA